MNTIDEIFEQAAAKHKQDLKKIQQDREQQKQREMEQEKGRRKEIDELLESARMSLRQVTKVGSGEKFRNHLVDLFTKKGTAKYRNQLLPGARQKEICEYHLCIPRVKEMDELGKVEEVARNSMEFVLIWDKNEDVSKMTLEIRVVSFRSGITDFDYPFVPNLETCFYPDDSYRRTLVVLSDPQEAIKLLAKR